MQPFKFQFEKVVKLTDHNKEYSGIIRVNQAIVLADERFNVHAFLQVAMQTTIPDAIEDIKQCFKNDFEHRYDFTVNSVEVDVPSLHAGNQLVPSGAGFQYELTVKVISDIYTCHFITDNLRHICFDKQGVEKIFVDITGLTIQKVGN